MTSEKGQKLIFIGYTNGDQILHATKAHGGEGCFFHNTDGGCYIPVYMLEEHAHRIETTSKNNVTLKTVLGAQEVKTD